MNRAKQLRLDARLTVTQAAEGAGIDHRTLRKVELGHMVDVRPLGRLADFYKVAPSELLAPAIFATGDAA